MQANEHIRKRSNRNCNNTKKSNTYQYNKRNLEKNKKNVETKINKDELIDETIFNDKYEEKSVKQEKFVFDEDNKKELTETVDSILEDIDLTSNKTIEEELEDTGIIPSVEEKDTNIVDEDFEKEIIEDILEDKESNIVDEEFEKEIIEDILEDKEEKESFEDYLKEREEILEDFEILDENVEETTEILDDEDEKYNTIRYDLYSLYEKENDFLEDKNSFKTVTDIDDKFLLVDSILEEDDDSNEIPDNVFVDKSEEEEYYNVVLWDSIIGFLFVVFTILCIFAIWFIVYLTTY